MTPDDRGEAQRPVDRIRAFRAELDALEAAGVSQLTPEQRQTITAHHDEILRRLAATYDVDRSDRAGQLSRGMQLASFFGAAALTAAVYSLVLRFWGRLDLPMQATLLGVFPLAALVGVELSARRERTLYVASLFGLVAYGTFWLAVGVLSEVVNIPVTPAAIWAGVLFGLALALPYGFRLILAAALAALTIAASGSVFQASGIPWTSIAEHPEMTTLVAFGCTLLAPRLAQVNSDFGRATRLTGFGIGLLGLLLLSTFGEMSLLPLSNRAVEAIYQGLTLLASLAVLVIAVLRRWSETANLAAAVLSLFLLLRFVDWFWDALPRYVFFLVLAAIAFGWLLVMRRVRTRLKTA